jgi:hypothetical protein
MHIDKETYLYYQEYENGYYTDCELTNYKKYEY